MKDETRQQAAAASLLLFVILHPSSFILHPLLRALPDATKTFR
jgi:hypothetical protein